MDCNPGITGRVRFKPKPKVQKLTEEAKLQNPDEHLPFDFHTCLHLPAGRKKVAAQQKSENPQVKERRGEI